MTEGSKDPASGANPKKHQTSQKKLRSERSYPKEFERFWDRYPRKVKKVQALKAWEQINDDLKQRALRAVEKFAEDCKKKNTEPEFFAHAPTWLNNDRWEDFEGEEHKPWFEKLDPSNPPETITSEWARGVVSEYCTNFAWPKEKLGPPPGAAGSFFTRFVDQIPLLSKYMVNGERDGH